MELNITKTQVDLLPEYLKAIFENEFDLIANLANASAVIMQCVDKLNWAGFYILKGDELVVGPFQGKVACSRIPLSRGVCGKAASTGKPLRVDDVHLFADHVACDSASNSELVIPLFVFGNLFGVLDLDSTRKSRFGDIEKTLIESASIIEKMIERITKVS